MAYALDNLSDRATMFINPATEVYEGMVVVMNSRQDDMVVNPCKNEIDKYAYLLVRILPLDFLKQKLLHLKKLSNLLKTMNSLKSHRMQSVFVRKYSMQSTVLELEIS